MNEDRFELAKQVLQSSPDVDIERIAAQVHKAWMEQKQADGVASRLSADGIEQMAPYEELPWSIQELDRSTVRAVAPFYQSDLHALASALLEAEEEYREHLKRAGAKLIRRSTQLQQAQNRITELLEEREWLYHGDGLSFDDWKAAR